MKTKFIVLSLLVLIFSLAFVSAENAPNFLTGKAVQPISFVKEGSNLTIETNTVPGVNKVTLHLIGTIRNGNFIINSDSNVPFTGKFYNKFILSSTDQDKIDKITFTFKIDKNKLFAAGVNFKELSLYVNGKKKDTSLLKEVGNYYFYTAESDEFGQGVLGVSTAKDGSGSADALTTSVESSVKPESFPTASSSTQFGEEQLKQAEEQQPSSSSADEPNLAGRASETENSSPGFFSRIANFFKNLFS
jgi:hypothetical protein